MKQRPNNLIVTGIPRSGTTLVATLVDCMEDSVCLSEPDWQSLWSQEMSDRSQYVARISKDFDQVRASLIGGDNVPDRRKTDGSAITNYFDRNGNSQHEIHSIRRDGLTDGFLLGMKHNAHYTCVLPELVQKSDFLIIAIIRHPIPTILSWRSLDIPIRQGRLPAAERFWPEIPALWESTSDLLEIQVRIYGLFCARYQKFLGQLKLIRYEDLVQNTALLEKHLERNFVRSVPVESHRPQSASPGTNVEQIKRYLRMFCPVAFEFYPELDSF